MELACKDRIPHNVPVYAGSDPVIFRDARVIDNLLSDEVMYVPRCNYFEEVQTDIEPYMRKVVTTWMLEVCEEQSIEDQVLPLAVNYMDRFLCTCRIKRSQLQLLAATCLLLASKIRCCNSFQLDLLSAYTDYSVTPENITSWEILVLSKLQWNLAAVTGFDYIDQLIERSTWGQDSPYLRRHAHTLVSICYTEPSLIQTTPSLIAAACVCSAIRGLKMPSSAIATRDICASARVLDPIALELLIRFIDQVVEKVIPPSTGSSAGQPTDKTANGGSQKQTHGKEEDDCEYPQPVTPKDVEEIYF